MLIEIAQVPMAYSNNVPITAAKPVRFAPAPLQMRTLSDDRPDNWSTPPLYQLEQFRLSLYRHNAVCPTVVQQSHLFVKGNFLWGLR